MDIITLVATTWPDAIVTLGGIAVIAFIFWLAMR